MPIKKTMRELIREEYFNSRSNKYIYKCDACNSEVIAYRKIHDNRRVLCYECKRADEAAKARAREQKKVAEILKKGKTEILQDVLNKIRFEEHVAIDRENYAAAFKSVKEFCESLQEKINE